MNNVIKRVWAKNSMVSIDYLGGSAFSSEEGGHTFQISGVDDNGDAVALAGTVAGVFLRPDNTDVAVAGTVADGVASVTLPENCYDVPGRFGLTIFLSSGDQKVAIYAAVGNVTRASSGTVAPQTTADVVDLINRISAAVATIPASWTGMMADIAPTYSDSETYPEGAYCYYNGDLYRSVVAITTAESWNASHWEAAAIADIADDVAGKADRTDTVLATTLSHGRKSGTTAGADSIAYGTNVEASGRNSAAFNGATVASGDNSVAFNNGAKATGSHTMAHGSRAAASGYASHAEGSETESSGYYSHAEGEITVASGSCSHAEGMGLKLIRIGEDPLLYPTTASGRGSHAEGYSTIANHRSQHVAGEYNTPDPSSAAASERGTYVEIIGNGTANDARSNARTLDWSGNEELAGDLVVKKGTNEEISVLALKAMIDALTQRLKQLESH